MPRYSYTCEQCQRQCDRTVKVADRDAQVCEATTSDDPVAQTSVCLGKLIREEISVTARMSHSWQP